MVSPLRLGFLFFWVGLASLCAQTTTLNLSTDLVPLGIAASNMVPNQPALDSTPLLEAGVKYANTKKLTLVTANPGAYYFLNGSGVNSTWNVAIANVTTPMTIDLQGSDLYFNHPEKGGLLLQSLTNVTLENFTVDFSQQLYTQIQVTAVNAAQRQLQFTVQPGWPAASTLNALYPLVDASGAANTSLLVFRGGQPIMDLLTLVSQPLADGTLSFTPSAPIAQIGEIQPGDTAVLYVRGSGGLGVLGNTITGCTLRNIKIYSGNVGFRSVAQSSTLLERIEVVPRPGTTRLISSIADGIDPAYFGANNIVRLCRAIRTCDDAFAPDTFVFATVQSVLGANSVQVEGDQGNLYFNGSYPLPNGASVAFQRPSDGTILGTATVVSQSAGTPINGLKELVLNFNQNVPSNLVGAYIYATDASGLGSGLLMERNTVQNQTFANGIDVWGLINTTLYGNYIQGASWSGILLQNHLSSDSWISPPSANVGITNNVVDGTDLQYLDSNWGMDQLGGIQIATYASTGGGVVAQSPNQNISLTGNFIANPGRSAIWFGNTTGGVANANTLFNPNNNPNPANASPNGNSAYQQFAPQAFQPMVVQASQNITVGANPIDQSSGRIGVTDTSYNELAAYAPGSTIRLSAYNLGTLGGPTVTLTDADGTVWPLSVVSTATHTVDAQLDGRAGLGGGVITVKAGSATYLGTLFLDRQDNVPAINQASFLVSPSATSVPAAGGTISFLVTTQGSSAYAIADSDNFVTPSAGGAGTGVVTLAFAKNNGTVRTTTVQVASQPFTLTQAGASDPIIVTQPQSQTVAVGGSASFSVGATGALSYRWSLNGVPVSGGTSSSLIVSGAAPASAGTYSVVATNASGSATSSGAFLTVSGLSAPTITVRPVNQTANAGGIAAFSIAATGGTGLTYQWTLNGTALAGATNPTLTLTNVQAANAGFYTVVVTNAAGASTTNLASLSVNSVAGPTFTVQPLAQVIASGSTVVFNAAASGTGAIAYQWLLNNGPIAGATSSRLVLSGATAANAGTYVCVATASGVSTTSNPATLTVTATPSPGRLVNLSVLAFTGPGAQILTVGFVSGGTGTSSATSENILIRGTGPAIAALGVPNTIADPKVTLFQGTTSISSNDNWGTPSANQQSVLAAQTASGSGFNLVDSNSLDAALAQALPPVAGGYSVQLSANNNGAGTTLAEVYDYTANYTPSSPRLVNISAKSIISPSTGTALTAGFTIGGSTSKTVLIRGTGPALAVLGVPGTLADPQITLHQNVNGQDTILAANAGWGGDPQITAASNAVFAFPLTNAGSHDSAILITLPPGGYSAQVTSSGANSGSALVEVYEIP